MVNVMISTRTAPWMTLGTVLDQDVLTAEQAVKLGGMDFEVELQPCFYQSTSGEFVKSDTRNWVVRTDTEELYDVVSGDYNVLQYHEAFSFLNEISPRFVAAGTLKGGKQGFVVVQAPETRSMSLLGGEDPHDLFIVVRTSHDRSRAVEAMVMPLRGRCMNQLGLQSFTAGVDNRWAIPHTSTMTDKLHAAQASILKLDAYADALRDTAERLASTPFTPEEGQKLIRRVLPDRPKTDEVVGRIMDLWAHGETVGYSGNGWGLVNAVSDYFDHGRTGGTQESRFVGALQGITYQMINKTAALALAA
jgi:phage/plasmid-like protein (TIGR03299 family)